MSLAPRVLKYEKEFIRLFCRELDLYHRFGNRKSPKDRSKIFSEDDFSKYIDIRLLCPAFQADFEPLQIILEYEIPDKGDPAGSDIDYCFLSGGKEVATCEFKGPYFRGPFFEDKNNYGNGMPELAADFHKQKERVKAFPEVEHFCALILDRPIQSIGSTYFYKRIEDLRQSEPGLTLSLAQPLPISFGKPDNLTLVMIQVGYDYDTWYAQNLIGSRSVGQV